MEWWAKGKYPLQTGRRNFLKIIDFYLFNCPVYKKSQDDRVSVRGQTFEERNITGKKLATLLKDMKQLVEVFRMVDKQEKVEESLKTEMEKLKYKDGAIQLIFFYENTDLGQTKTIFDSIRNALAHGAFSIKTIKKEKYYYFENKYKKTVKAQFKIKESTLLKWVELIEEYTI